MKRLALTMALLLIAAALTACGSRDDTPALSDSRAQPPAGAQAEAASDETPRPTDEAPAPTERPVDLDLTKLSGTVVYSQVYDMMAQPENYRGKKVRIRGNFSYYKDPNTAQEYFAAVIADATACCAQGIEFVWAGEHAYPADYPPLNTEIVVTGLFDTYYEGDYMYVRLTDARVEWEM